MSEYQCYEFVSLDRPLSAKQIAELRAISTRAEISPTRFWNEYQWGDLKADPAKLMERYFDAHLYFANWGTRRIMLRLPKACIDKKVLEPYFPGRHAARLTKTGDHLLLDLSSDNEDNEYVESPGSLATLSPLRAEVMRGDLRAAYIAWLLAVQAGEVDDDDAEPPVPAGLGRLTAAQEAMIEILRIDADLIAAAASGSAIVTDDREPILRWVVALSAREKDAWLKRAVEQPDLPIGTELERTFRAKHKAVSVVRRRTVGELRSQAETERGAREKQEAARARRAQAAADGARARQLAKLAHDVDGAWRKLTKLVENSRYDEAVSLAIDLRDLAARDGEQGTFAARFAALRRSQMRRRGFFERWKRAEARP